MAMWFAQSKHLTGAFTAKMVSAAQVAIDYDELRIIMSPREAMASLENLRTVLEAAGCVPVTIEVVDESDEGQPS